MKFREAYNMVMNESIFQPATGKDLKSRYSRFKNPLIHAIIKSNSRLFDVLIKDPDIDVNEADELNRTKDTPLILAIEKYYNYYVDKLVGIPSLDVNKPDAEGFTPLMIAITGRKYDIVDTLLTRRDLDVNRKGPSGKTAMDYMMRNIESYLDSSEIYDAMKYKKKLLGRGAKTGKLLDNPQK
jgi:ankyrin repeat protein